MPVIINGSTGISGTDGTASVPAIQGTDTNTGVYFPGADRIGFAEGGVQVGEFDANSNFLFNSGYGSVAVAYGCRAWVNFNGTGTVAIRASGNVSSITDNGVGNYTVNITNAMPDANYAVISTMSIDLTSPNYAYAVDVYIRSTTSCRIGTGFFTGSTNVAGDATAVDLSILR